MVFKNGIVFIDGEFTRTDVLVTDGKIASFGGCLTDDDEVDLNGNFLLPGLVDVHTHGVLGSDFATCTKLDVPKMVDFYLAHGTTTLLPTIISTEKMRYMAAFCSLKYPDTRGAIGGIHMEGPFFGWEKSGAQKLSNLIPINENMIRELMLWAPFPIKIISMDPTLAGADDFIRHFSPKTTIAFGHTNATNARSKEAFLAGGTHVTHLFNAMSPMLQREPGLAAAALTSDATCELICDGIHLHPDIIKIAFALLGKRAILISDSMAGTGMPDGVYDLGGQNVHLKNRRATLENGTLAGSSSTLFDCLVQAINVGIAPEQAVLSATTSPGRLIGHPGEYGELCVGANADILIVSKSWELLHVYKYGVLV